MKKVAFYCGLEHHYHKLSPLMWAVEQSGNAAIPVISSNSINNDPSWLYARSDPRFVHSNDYIDDSIMQQAIGQIRGMSNHIKSLSHSPPFWYFHSLNEAAVLFAGFSGFLKSEKPNALLILHSNNFFANIFAFLAHKHNIYVASFQEGILRPRDQETMQKQSTTADYCNTVFVWNKQGKRALINAGIPAKKIKISGMPHMDGPIFNLDNRDEIRNQLGFDNRPVVLFALPTISEYRGDLKDDIIKLHNFCHENNLVLIVKPHPTNKLAIPNVNIVGNEVNLYLLIIASDVVVTQGSTVGIESLALNTPVLEMAISGNSEQSYTKLGMAHDISDNMQIILDVINGQKTIPSRKIRDFTGPIDGKAHKRILAEVLK